MRSKASRSVMAMVAGLLICACSDNANQVAPVSFDTIVTVASTVAPTTVVPSTTTEAPTTVAPTIPQTTVPETTLIPVPTIAGLTGPVFSDALGVKVPTAPGVNTPGDTRQLMPEGLYVHIAWTADPNDMSVFTVFPGDEPILEAYANAVATYYRAATTTVTTDDPDFDKYIVDADAMFGESFSSARASNLVLSLGAGVVLRPYVLSDRTTPDSATIFDCYLQDQAYVERGTSPTSDGILEQTGQVVTLVLVNSVWMVDLAGSEPRACL